MDDSSLEPTDLYNKGLSLFKSGKKVQAMPYFQAAARKGLSIAKFQLAVLFSGPHSKAMLESLINDFRSGKMSGQGSSGLHAWACYYLGLHHQVVAKAFASEQQMDKSHEALNQAASYFAAAATELALGRIFLAHCFHKGEGVKQDLVIAKEALASIPLDYVREKHSPEVPGFSSFKQECAPLEGFLRTWMNEKNTLEDDIMASHYQKLHQRLFCVQEPSLSNTF